MDQVDFYCGAPAKTAEQPERLFPDPRREMARKAGQAHWAEWASKKVR